MTARQETPNPPQTAAGQSLGAMPCSAFREAWADHCGVDADSEEAEYGWPRDRDNFLAGWQSNESKARQLLSAIVAQYDAAPDGPLGKGFTNGPFLAARDFLSSPNT